MTWYWWAAIAIYAAGALGGVTYAGVRYQRESEAARNLRGVTAYQIRRAAEKADNSAIGTCVLAIAWPVASVLVVLYYGITAPFWLGRWIERRKAEQRKALKKQYREQADNLHRLAQDYAGDSVERKILLDSAQYLVDQANTLK